MPPTSLDVLDLRDLVRVIGEDDLEPSGFVRRDLDWTVVHGVLLVLYSAEGSMSGPRSYRADECP
jgi:hypothetical protein